MKHFVRNILMDAAHQLERGAKQLRGAADKVIPEKRLFLMDMERQGWKNVRPCFVLSTGRCGTLLLNNLLQLSPDADPNHEPKPELFRPSRRAYEDIDHTPEIFREVFKSAREEYLLKAARQEKVYIETNNQCTFFAPIIRDIFPRAVFIHLVRHPGSFVRSGIRRKWYTGEHSHDIGRIVPVAGPARDRWGDWSLIEKIGWLWNETNQFIENFLATLPADSHLFIKAEELFSDVAISEALFSFLQIDGFHQKTVQRIIDKPVNTQRKGGFAAYLNWHDKDKKKLLSVVSMSSSYNYNL